MPVIFDQVIGKVDPPPALPPEAQTDDPPPAAAIHQQVNRIVKLKAERQARLTAD